MNMHVIYDQDFNDQEKSWFLHAALKEENSGINIISLPNNLSPKTMFF